MIKKSKDKWILYSKDGSKKLGSFPSKEEAIKREQQINYFRSKKKKLGEILVFLLTIKCGCDILYL